jgi:hypothetical protein
MPDYLIALKKPETGNRFRFQAIFQFFLYQGFLFFRMSAMIAEKKTPDPRLLKIA